MKIHSSVLFAEISFINGDIANHYGMMFCCMHFLKKNSVKCVNDFINAFLSPLHISDRKHISLPGSQNNPLPQVWKIIHNWQRHCSCLLFLHFSRNHMVVVTATNNPEVEFPDVKLLDLITAGPQLLKRCLHFT